MAVEVAGALAPAPIGFPGLVQAPEDYAYAGNYLARELRNICNDTKGLFPKSAKRDPSYYAKNGKPIRYQSYYETDFNGRYWKDPKYRSLPKFKVEEEKWPVIGQHPVEDKKDKRKKFKMFMNWKIPERIASNDGSARGTSRESKASKHSAKSDLSVKSEQLPKIPELACATPVPARAKTVIPAKSTTPRLPAKSPARPKPAQAAKEEAIKRSLDPGLQRKAQELLENAAPCERRAIEKAIFAAQRAGKQGPGQPKMVYKTDAKVAVNKWLDDATDEERDLAVKFFQSVSASRMMGDSQDQKKRLNQVLFQLSNGQARGVSQSHPGHPMKSDKRGLKTVQLYPPADRKNRWQHTTWHHMPNYRDIDPVNNRSSIYTDSQKVIPRHYTIHPDWGM